MLTDKDIAKLAASLTESLATKGDINDIKEDVHGIKDDIFNIKDDIKDVKDNFNNIRVDVRRLESKIGEVDNKVEQVLKYADAIEETTSDHENRIKKLEIISTVAHKITK